MLCIYNYSQYSHQNIFKYFDGNIINSCTCWYTIMCVSLLHHIPPQGIGDSGQGMMNGILFVFLTKAVTSSVQRRICCCRKPADTIQRSGSSNGYRISDADEAWIGLQNDYVGHFYHSSTEMFALMCACSMYIYFKPKLETILFSPHTVWMQYLTQHQMQTGIFVCMCVCMCGGGVGGVSIWIIDEMGGVYPSHSCRAFALGHFLGVHKIVENSKIVYVCTV